MTPNSPSSSYDVLVVGAGPSGLTTAIAMAQVRRPDPADREAPEAFRAFPKATGLRPRTMEILRSWGLEQTVLSQSQPTRLSMADQADAVGRPGPRCRWDCPSPSELRAASPSQIAVCPQDRLEAILLDHLLERGGEVRFSTELTGLDRR